MSPFLISLYLSLVQSLTIQFANCIDSTTKNSTAQGGGFIFSSIYDIILK